MYSNNDIFDVDIQKVIKCYKECSEIHFEYIITEIDNDLLWNDIRYNKYCYRSFNDLGLIYLTVLEDISNGVNFIKEVAFGEYPFGQNNFGLLNQFYLNKINDAEYMNKRASCHHFCLSEYNLGFLKEKNNEIEESIQYFIKASEDEDHPLLFQNHKHIDEQLEISKIFIICFTNLKLAKYYFTEKNYDESRKYFIKTFNKLILKGKSLAYNFQLKFNFKQENIKKIFSYIKNFILQFPLFDLNNVPNIKLNDYIDKNICEEKKKGDYFETEKNHEIKNKFSFDFHEFIKMKKNGDKITFENIENIFELFISSQINKELFIEKIQDIIQSIEQILYPQPYPILFGRINLSKMKPKIKQNEKITPNQNDINCEFYNVLSSES